MQKIIFLDIDGVLNSRKFFSKYPEIFAGDELLDQLDPEAITRLNRVIAATEAKVVISSTWRLMWPVEKIVAALKSCGFVGEVIGITENFEREWGQVRRPRALEIEAFIQTHNIEHFVVVDDDPICEDGESLDIVAKLVRTTFDDGLTDEAADKMIEALSQMNYGH